ncbi:MAG TPA: cbb3-type cytochrome oxidase assembly protein CcoS [Xanthobacteraceae bacterium]|nr:cbb3-type cytochrome oxidase assembly protein CcoS [Xanthobacteraceae bacterium]
MEVLVYLMPMALALGLLGLGGFLWSLKTGQYDDLDGAAWRAILDEDDIPQLPAGETADGGRSAGPQL